MTINLVSSSELEVATAFFEAHPQIEVIEATKSVAEHLEELLNADSNSLLVMSTRGHGRTAAVIGSVATHVLGATHRPAVLIGPACHPERFRLHGPLIVATDASEYADAALDVAAWAVRNFEYEPTVVNVRDPDDARLTAAATSPGSASDVALESGMVHRFANALTERSGVDSNFEVLHGRHVGETIADYANRQKAAA